jgi:nicotinate-nucleotide--dimethylbenzimidazole phosphoribosyltransferase
VSEQPPTLRSLADLRAVIDRLPGPDRDAAAKAAAREPTLTKPPHSLGRLEELSAWLATWQGRHPPTVQRIATWIFAGNHGVAARRVSAFPADVTAQMVANFEAGGAAVNQVCRAVGADLYVDAIDLEQPTADITTAPALSEAEFMAAVRRGEAATRAPVDLLCLGEMGIGNTTVAAALAHGVFGGDATAWTGPGTGLDDSGIARKAAVVATAVATHRAWADDPLELMRRLGGRELAAIAGAVLGARLRRIPVVLDGFICTMAVAPLVRLRDDVLDHCAFGHVSSEPGHRRILDLLGRRPILDLDMRLGEGSGAVLAAAVIKAAAACHAGMATFADAGVSNRGAE